MDDLFRIREIQNRLRSLKNIHDDLWNEEYANEERSLQNELEKIWYTLTDEEKRIASNVKEY